MKPLASSSLFASRRAFSFVELTSVSAYYLGAGAKLDGYFTSYETTPTSGSDLSTHSRPRDWCGDERYFTSFGIQKPLVDLTSVPSTEEQKQRAPESRLQSCRWLGSLGRGEGPIHSSPRRPNPNPTPDRVTREPAVGRCSCPTKADPGAAPNADNMKMKLDFSKFHPLDHAPWESRCRELYGGWRVHLKYWWAFKGREDLFSPILSRTTCKVGLHQMQPWWRGEPGKMPDFKTDTPTGYACRWCSHSTRTPNDQEETTEGSA